MKTKYIKVPVSERMPEKPGTYDSNLGEVFYNNFRERFEHNDKATDLFPEYWFCEVPDREDEVREMLEQKIELNIQTAKENIKYCLENNMENSAHSWEGRILAYRECLQLLNKLK